MKMMRYRREGSRMWSFMSWMDIESKVHPGEVYLRRLRILNTPWLSVYLHWIHEEDFDRFPHDHPWNFWSIITQGEYAEELFDHVGAQPVTRTWRRWSRHRMSVTQAHRIIRITGPLLTLVVTGRRQQVWGFWTSEGKVPYGEYLRKAPGA